MSLFVCAVVVTHNRPEMAVRCIRSLLAQSTAPDRVVVFDTASAPETQRRLTAAGVLADPRVQYRRSERNLGSAGGFRAAMQAGRPGADWLWILDDDTEADAAALGRLLAHAGKAEIVAVAGKKVWSDGEEQRHHQRRFSRWTGCRLLPAGAQAPAPIDLAAFTGLLVRTRVIDRVGYPRADLFVWGDDMEFCFRLRSEGRILFEPGAVLVHHEPRDAVAGRWRRRSDLDAYWKTLCCLRNFDYLMRTHTVAGGLRSVARLARKLAKIAVFEDAKLFRAKWLLRYYRDSFRAEFRNIDPAEWRRMAAPYRGKG
jgi:rhamnopyranosyl-N-acetylglucosaminyl-diphospho-decaprenol beta-1,3/1,4-galactofuranosyltransferase